MIFVINTLNNYLYIIISKAALRFLTLVSTTNMILGIRFTNYFGIRITIYEYDFSKVSLVKYTLLKCNFNIHLP